jgi:hypothetical protein
MKVLSIHKVFDRMQILLIKRFRSLQHATAIRVTNESCRQVCAHEESNSF